MSETLGIARAWVTARDAGRRAALATVIRTHGSTFRRPGARMLILDDGTTAGSVSGGCLEGSIIDASADVIRTGRSVVLRYDGARDDVLLGEGAMCDGEVAISVESVDAALSHGLSEIAELLQERDLFIMIVDDNEHGPRSVVSIEPARDPAPSAVLFRERIQAPLKLILCGAGALASSIARLSSAVGWDPLIVDHRPHFLASMVAPTHSIEDAADLEPLLARPGRTAVVIMTHHYERDAKLLETSVRRQPLYVGLLGSRARSARLVRELRQRHDGLDLSRLHAPTGLEIGSETIEEIALSIVSEIQAVRRGASGGSLRNASDPVHGRRSARLAGIVLAAGQASRMGGEKLRLTAPGGESLIRRAVLEVQDLDLRDLVVVTGADESLGDTLGGLSVRRVSNENWSEGIASSIRRGIDSLGDDVDGALIVLADQPRIGRTDLERLADAWRRGSAPVVATAYPEGGGVPAVFDRTLFDELRALEGDQGAKELIRSLQGAQVVTVPDTRDVDDPQSYATLSSETAT